LTKLVTSSVVSRVAPSVLLALLISPSAQARINSTHDETVTMMHSIHGVHKKVLKVCISLRVNPSPRCAEHGVVGNTFWLKQSYSTPGPVSTAMADCLRAGKPSQCEACQLGRRSLLPSLGW